ncbi:MAG: hypothetical protein PHP53_23575 [Prolixibacteraceae bacterium]|nr:hypothetical protein [Prolixibacteraceae bacterium]
MEDQNIYQIEFSKKLNELGFAVHEGFDNTFRLNLNEDDLKGIAVKLITSEPINERIHGTKNNTEIKAIGYFRFNLSPESIELNFYLFAFNNAIDDKVEFVIVPTYELRNRLNQRKCNTDMDQDMEVKFWLLPPENYLFETTYFGGEGEWWFIGGRMGKNTNMDFTQFLNQWQTLR